MLTLVCVLVWLACGFGSKAMADQRGSDLGGLALGLFLGPLGLALALSVFTTKPSSAIGENITAGAVHSPAYPSGIVEVGPESQSAALLEGKDWHPCPVCCRPVRMSGFFCPACNAPLCPSWHRI